VRPLLLVSHGSRDPQAQQTTQRLAAAVAMRLEVPVGVGYLELALPTVGDALDTLGGSVVVQPLLFAPAFHATDDLPDQLSGRPDVLVAPVLAPDPLLLDALDRRLAEAIPAGMQPDGLVLVSAGTGYPQARSLLDSVADAWGGRHGVPGISAYASMSPAAGEALRTLRDRGCERVAVGSLFIAPGRLPAAARESALAAGAVTVTEPLAECDEMVTLVVQRYRRTASGPIGPPD